MQVDFYQLSRDPVEATVPAIARRVLDGGGRLLVVSAERDQLDRISEGLWSAGPESYLANDHADAPMPQVQPILLAPSCDAANGARHVALADGLWRDEALGFERVFYFFDDATVAGARLAWKALSRSEDVTPRFWKQDGGRWRQGP
ncbi:MULTISPECIES: DNA polymerase III subunit chi [unclassified Sphingobium]|uniref:DNA polymerase III subunit chi n=1 Tax=unclassified Sphingobium TaxID=2611147 RepID=UPI0022241303|nr:MULTISPECIES: DNA polymerase III subunit chi [unclassified Sphingobium]MCW2350232.1 DNA polymerase-3 subunit chi [Sphingobium sp. B12D2B]MCW2369336.1 DNA polymerase-3 subunit chi [Sphingobium sp. B11D3D]MCW2394377.1 DNA polymerase-3 subunit chi [Sphingobium sp. B8D3B]MCW2417891.1 DNA polymerase-3 subunit chi [Sphingobium sp. B8D3C]